MSFARLLLIWYDEYKRHLDWTGVKDPYKVWLSEVILQQTRVQQGLPYYRAFLEAYPTIRHLARAEEDEIMKLWQGLGYYSRARHLLATAFYIVEQCDGVFPNNYKDLKKLKGVGDYTAAAIASFCYGESIAVLDGNVYRVLARYYGITLPINTSKGKNYFQSLANKISDVKNISIYNQAIMDFGALQCKPKNPNCNNCPLQIDCVAFQTNDVVRLPIKIRRGSIKKRYFSYLIIKDKNNKTIIHQRTKDDIWQQLYEFPLIETVAPPSIDDIYADREFTQILGMDTRIELLNRKAVTHKLTHQHIFAYFWGMDTERSIVNAIDWSEVSGYAMPVLLSNFLKRYDRDT